MGVQQRSDSLHRIVESAIRQFVDNPIVSRRDLSVSTLSLGEMSPLVTNPHCSPYPLTTPAVNAEESNSPFQTLFASITDAQKQLMDAQKEGEMYTKTQEHMRKDKKKMVFALLLSLIAIAI